MPLQPTSTLPSDIYALIFVLLDVSDIAVLRRTCKEFYHLSKLKSIWQGLLLRDVVGQNIPIPGIHGESLQEMETETLEKCYQRAMLLRKNWISASPRIQREIPLVLNSRAIGIYVLPGHGNNWVAFLTFTAGRHRLFTLQCWDIGGASPICLAQLDLNEFRGISLNRVSSAPGALAILNPELQILSIDPNAADPDQGFVTEVVIPGIENATGIHFFAGSQILTRTHGGSLTLWGIDGEHVVSRHTLQGPHHVVQHTPIVDVLVTDQVIVLLGATTLELYSRPSGTSISSDLHLISSFRWPWGIDNAVMTLVHSPFGSQQVQPIDIMVRFRSYYPWALNILHHYTLYPNKDFLAESPVSEHNSPFNSAPTLRETVGSPVRLHSTSDMAIGPYGTALWTDSHTEDYFNHADRGQRVAGIFSRYVANEGEVELSDQVATATATSVYTYHEEDSWVRIALDEVEGRIFLGRDDGVISILEYV